MWLDLTDSPVLVRYVVAVYQYMRLCGYPAERISILSPYNGQKHLIRDVLNQRCNNPLFGLPARYSMSIRLALMRHTT
jgi:hypothetical protein